MVLQRIVKPKNQRVKRALEKREPKIEENDKFAMFLKGAHIDHDVKIAMTDLYSLKKPLALMYQKKNVIRPFEDQTPIEFFSNKSDASLFLIGSHSKKRPKNMVFGRLFDRHVLDMIELRMSHFKSCDQHNSAGKTLTLGSKPCLVFAGEPFEQDREHQRLKSLLIDFFRGTAVSKLTIKNVEHTGLEYAMFFTAADGKIYLRVYKIQSVKSGQRTPYVELEEMGPSIDFVMGRSKLASDDLYKRSRKQPKAAKPRKVKNVTRDAFGTKLGRIHMQAQDLSKLQLRKVKALKTKKGRNDGDDGEEPSKKMAKNVEDMNEN